MAKHSKATSAPQTNGRSVSGSAGLISICVIISRITGFARTLSMAFALGATLLSSSYQVANTLPNLLYELVAGGIIVTAFLPVYLSVKKERGPRASNRYASNLLTLATLLLVAVTVLCLLFPQAVIYTQSFYSSADSREESVFFFQFFAVQIVFYGISAVVSGLLNANRDYFWSSIAPAANNVVVIATFALYAVVSPANQTLALYIIAIGNPLGVFVQMAMQLPALKRNGIYLRFKIDLHDPAIRETLAIGLPALFVMVCSFAVTSVQNAASYSFSDGGPSILAYARLWFTLPYAFLAVPVTTAMFTELADMHAEGNAEGVRRGIMGGTAQIVFFMVPFALYLVVFATPLVTLYHAGAFTMESVREVASYLAVIAGALPFYAVNTYLQKTFSTLRKMGVFAGFNLIACLVQIALTLWAGSNSTRVPIEMIAVAEIAFFIVGDVCLFAYLRHLMGRLGMVQVWKAAAAGAVFGGLGAAAGAGVLFALETYVSPLGGGIVQALLYIACGGLVALAVTFVPAMKLHVPEARFVAGMASRLTARLKRR